MPDKIKIPVVGLDNTYAAVPDHDVLSKQQSSTDYLHGDGFFPLYKDKMAKVEPGTGLNVLINDYFALIDGYKVSYRGIKELDWTKKVTFNVSSAVGKGDMYVALKPGVDEQGKKCSKEGIFFLTNKAPNDRGVIILDDGSDSIPVAKINIPAGTTQVTTDMIDNSVKKWLVDVDYAIANLRDYVNEAVGRVEARLISLIMTQFLPEIRNEIAQGDQNVLNQINAIVGTPNDTPDINGSTIWSRINFIQIEQGWQWDWSNAIWNKLWELFYFLQYRIEQLETKSDQLVSWYQSLQDAVNQTESWKASVQQELDKTSADIVAIQNELENHLQRIENLERQSSLQQGIFDLTNAINIAKTNWQIQQIHQLSVNELYKGYTDILKDLSKVDTSLSSNYVHNSTLTRLEAKKPSVEGLVSWWKFDEGQGNVALDSVGGNHGTLVNGPTWVDGKYGKALSFDGVNDYVETAQTVSLALTTSASIAVWFKTTAAAYQEIVRQIGTSDNGIELRVSSSHKADVSVYLGSWREIIDTNGPNVNDGNWHHIVGVVDGTTVKLYRDGNFIISATGTNNLNTGNAKVVIGRHPLYPDYFNGLIDDVQIYNRALSADEIAQIYQYGLESLMSSNFTPGTIITKSTNYGFVPSQVVVTAVYGGDVAFEISRDNGTTWYQITPDTLFTFPENAPEGQDVRLKMTLNTPDSYVDNYGIFLK